MARIRSLKPEIWMSPQVMNLSHGARLLFIGLITQADDQGKGVSDARKLKAAVFGGDDITSADVRRWLDECSTQGLVVLYTDEQHGDLYLLTSWRRHQSIDRPKPSTYPNPDDKATARRPFVESRTISREGSEGIGGDRNGSEGIVPRACAREGDPSTGNGGASTSSHPSNAELLDGFVVFCEAYPKRAQRPSLLDEREWQQRIEDGVEPQAMLEGAQRYARYCANGGVSSPVYVLAIKNFLSIPNRFWLQDWTLPGSSTSGKIRTAADIAEEFENRDDRPA